MAFAHGKNTVVILGGDVMSHYFNNTTVTRPLEPAESTTFKTLGGSKTYIPGLNDGTIAFEGFYADSIGQGDHWSDLYIRDGVHRPYTVGPDGMEVGDRVWMAVGPVTAYEVSSPVAGMTAVSVECQASGGVQTGVSLHPMMPSGVGETVTGNGATYDSVRGATVLGGLGIFQLWQGPAVLTSLDVKIQHSVDGVAWTDLIVFPQYPTPGARLQSIRTASTATVNRYLRSSWVYVGTSYVNFAVSFARNLLAP